MHRCACPYHKPTATMGHSIHNIEICNPLTHTTPNTLSAICPVQWKPGFIREENTSPKCQTPSNVSICPLKSVTMMNCSQVETPMRTMSMHMSFPETVSDILSRNSLFMQTDCCRSWWLVSDDLGGEDAGGPGLVWLHVVCSCKAGWMYGQILLKCLWRQLMVEINIQFMGNSSGGHSCSQHANCTLPQNLRHLWHCALWWNCTF